MMLILTRIPSESIHIGDNIKVTVLADRRNQVKTGKDAPTGIEIWWEETKQKVRAEEQTGNRDI